MKTKKGDLFGFVRKRGRKRGGIPLFALQDREGAKRLMDQEVERHVRRWSKKLLLVHGGVVRKLTDEEIDAALKASRSPRKRKANR